MSTKTNIDPGHACVGELSVRYRVTASFIVTLGMHELPHTKRCIAQIVDDLIEASGGIEDSIDTIEIHAIEHDSGETLAESTES